MGENSVKWTKEQEMAINEKGSNILVAAAAGSGKTAVLVERIINKVINDKVDIDKILMVTFTNAAASEMRERILQAIYKKLEEEPENADLQRQIILLNKSNISTIHSFCLDVIRNNFFEIDTSANFRVADTAEMELLKQEIIDDLFEEKYVNEDKDFFNLLNTYTTYRGDEKLQELILGIYRFIQSSPFPERWIKEQVQKFDLAEKLDRDFSETIWGQIILENFKEEVFDAILKLRQVENNLARFDELHKYRIIISEDIEKLEGIIQSAETWEGVYESVASFSWSNWPTDRKITLELKQEAKEIRDSVKKQIDRAIKKYLICNSKQANLDMYEMYPILNSIKDVVLEFSKKFSAKKKEKNIVDFNDIEHFALNILLEIDENGNIHETDVAKKYKEKFEEIAVDEYQDSNMVQEYILKSISKGNNIFMVGDVKQSIYRFRQARPDLFLDKYQSYKVKGEEITSGMKIQLFKNFRSRNEVLNITNLIFKNIMSYELGEIDYNQDEFLNYGANYPEYEEGNNNLVPELHVIDLKQDEENDYYNVDNGTIEEFNAEKNATSIEQEEESEEDDKDKIENVVLEAKYVAKSIQKLIDSQYMVFDKKTGYRKVEYKDIVILLRSTKGAAPIFEKEIANLNMPVFSDVSSEYLESFEIQTIMSLLKIIDNPMQDIPLVTVLRSSIGGFTDNELVEIRGKNKNISFFDSLMNYNQLCENCEEETQSECNSETANKELHNKVRKFIKSLKKWQAQEKYMSLDELIWQIYSDTNFYNYVTLLPNGSLRQANLKILFERARQYETASFKGLFNFINFMDKLHGNSGDLSSAKLIGENENVIRIMSIHKSKGLEFPVVFLACTGKQFNMRDLNDSIILHQQLGLGPKYINSEKKIEYTTLAREAIRLKAKNETMSEEMRVLYVALTRAKEKLIITGISKDLKKSFDEKKNFVQVYKNGSNIVSHILLKKYQTYLDWIELVYFNNMENTETNINEIIKMNIVKKNEFIDELNKTEEEEQSRNIAQELEEMLTKIECRDILEEIEQRLNWKYEYMESSVVPTKTSVTKVKEAESYREDSPVINLLELYSQKAKKKETVPEKETEENDESEFAIARPKFLNEDEAITPAQKGTLMHYCFQKLDEKKEYTKADISKMLDEFVTRKLMTKLEADSINVNKILSYTKSDLFKELKSAKEVYKEQPFYINLTSNEIYNNASNDNILVQGIIDLYYKNVDGDIVLVDYKTDYVDKGKEQELVEKYKKQIDIYKRALEESLGKKVKRCSIYSVYLEKMIDVI